MAGSRATSSVIFRPSACAQFRGTSIAAHCMPAGLPSPSQARHVSPSSAASAADGVMSASATATAMTSRLLRPRGRPRRLLGVVA
ncbi:hypothetical protein [Nonomuraea longicatena]|uniref:hypothetical protein n=1 Tax=Nonomuraea longicatena TaxID=83682 RepID=UPI0031D94C11